MYDKQDCIEALQQASKELGETPSKNQYSELDISPSSSTTFENVFGSWNKAKEAAGLETLDSGSRNITGEGDDNPAYIGKKDFIRHKKEQGECSRCGEDERVCLVFHHRNPDDKVKALSRMSQEGGYTLQEVKNEVEKCELICRNCHAKEHYN